MVSDRSQKLFYLATLFFASTFSFQCYEISYSESFNSAYWFFFYTEVSLEVSLFSVGYRYGSAFSSSV